MVETTLRFPSLTLGRAPREVEVVDEAAQRYTQKILERHKLEGLELAVRARWIALGIVAVMLPFIIPGWAVLWSEFMLCLLALNGYFLRRFGHAGRSRIELLFIFIDVVLVAFALLMRNPILAKDWPSGIVFEFQLFQYFYVILAVGALSYAWRTLMAVGNWVAIIWTVGAVVIWRWGETVPQITDVLQSGFPDAPLLAALLDPNLMQWDRRMQEVVVFIIVAYTLAILVRRFNNLLLGNATLERERANLSRYFSPSVVEELSHNDEPLKQVRAQEVAVLFVDIVGFTSYAATREAHEVIATLRAFHGRMEACVFAHGGTLDKFLGDGLMATFGTPVAGPDDAAHAVAAVEAMVEAVAALNAERVAGGHPEIDARFGLHYGPVVLGDIGARRLEFAVIGNTVNVASRLEGLSREMDVQVVASDTVIAAAGAGTREGWRPGGAMPVRGVAEPVEVWTFPRAPG